MGKLIKIDFTVECVDFQDDQGCIDVPVCRELMFDDSALAFCKNTAVKTFNLEGTKPGESQRSILATFDFSFKCKNCAAKQKPQPPKVQ